MKSNLRAKYELIQRKRTLEKGLQSDELEVNSLQEQVKELRGKLKGVSVTDKKVIDEHHRYEKIDELTSILEQDISSAKESLSAAWQSFEYLPTSVELEEETPDREDLLKAVNAVRGVIDEAKKQLIAVASGIGLELEEGATALSEELKTYNTALESIKVKRETHQRLYEEAKGRLSSQENIIKEISQIENRLAAIQKELLQKKQSLQKIGDAKSEYDILRQSWSEIYASRALAIEAKCKECTELSNNLIKITLEKAAGTFTVEENFRKAMTGAKIQSEKIKNLFGLVRNAPDPIAQWNAILDELEKIGIFNPEDQALSLPSVPIMHGQGFIATELERMAGKFSPEQWFELSIQGLEDMPKFEYRSAEGAYI